MTSQLNFPQSLPKPRLFEAQTLVIYDRKLVACSAEFRRWIKRWPVTYGVRAGEQLKDVAQFPQHCAKILHLTQSFSASKMRIVTVGGGSVGDFGGFMASVLKRGVRLTHIPSTWLAALDSAHGGKTALNVNRVKNQIGTFYPADAIYVVRSLLLEQPERRAREAFGELAKIALVDGRKWTRALLHGRLQSHQLLWKYLRPAIEAKMTIVTRDPLEKRGIRQILNLGHTLGHILEACRSVSHGEAVGQGLYFSLKWSLQRGMISLKDYFACVELLNRRLHIQCWLEGKVRYQPMTSVEFQQALTHDKKRSSRDRILFIFLRKWGQPVAQEVSIAEILSEARRQGWVR